MLIENATGEKIKVLRIDNGMEFCHNDFIEYYNNSEIEKHKIVRLTPQKYFVVERLNRTLLEIMRCSLSNSHLSKHCLDEAVQIASHLINKSPTSTINFKTPDDIWYRKTSSYAYLRIFGCVAFVHVK